MPSPYQRCQIASCQSGSKLEPITCVSTQRRPKSGWAELRGGRLGVTFRRQVVVGRYIADFASFEAHLAIEVDGGVHQIRAHLDQRRDEHLCRAGYRVVRIPAELVIANPSAALALVSRSLAP